MNTENNIYKRPTQRVTGMSSRQQVLFLLQKTQKEANWDMDNDSDFYDEYSQETETNQHNSASQPFSQVKRPHNSFSLPYNEEFEMKREKLRQQELQNHPERFRLLAHSLSQFIPIKKNKYLERKRYVLSEKEASSLLVCNCQKASHKKNEKTNPLQSFNCGERCINRCVSTECCAQTCPSGAFCKNRRFQLHQNAYVYPAKTEKKGYGLFAGEFIPKGTFIMQYVGEVFSVDTELGQKRVLEYRKSTCTYLMRTTNNEVIDPTYVGNIARFINHSCEPSCETQKWNVLGEVCVGIFALRDIHENEELSFDYQFDFFKTPFTKCYCGTSKCKGYLGVLSKITDDDDEEIENPSCNICEDYITDKDDLLVCNGSCRETFHLYCIIKKEGKTKTQAQALMQQSDRRNFICRDCIVNIRKKRGRKSAKELLQDDMQYNNNNPSHTRLLETILENPQEDKDDIVLQQDIEVPPWESTDPEIMKFFQDTPQNQELDMIIKREADQIEANLKAINEAASTGNNKLKRAKKKNSQFSDHYNFISELQKRLKMRIDGDRNNYKFRKFKDDIQELKRLKQLQIEAKKLQRLQKLSFQQQQQHLQQFQQQYNQQQHLLLQDDGKKKRGRPRKIQSSLSFNRAVSSTIGSLPTQNQLLNIYGSGVHHHPTLQQSMSVQINDNVTQNLLSDLNTTKDNNKKINKNDNDEMQIDTTLLVTDNKKQKAHHHDQLIINSQNVEASEQSDGDQEQDGSQTYSKDVEDGKSEEEDEDMEEDDDEEEGDDVADLEEFDTEVAEVMLEDEEDDEDDDDEDDSFNDEQDPMEDEANNELDLDKLQGQYETQEEQKDDKMASSDIQLNKESSNNQLHNHNQTNLFSNSLQQSLSLHNQKRLRLQSGANSELISPILPNNPLRTPHKNSTQANNSNSPLKAYHLNQTSQLHHHSSIYDQINQEKQRIIKLASSKIDSFLNEQIKASSTLTPSELIVRESKFNVFESVFNLVIPDNIDTLQCLPTKFQVFWEQAWGGMITVRLQSTFKQYQFITNLMQEITDQMYKSNFFQNNSSVGHLNINGGVNILSNLHNTNSSGHTFGSKIELFNKKDVKQQFPFEIVMMKVPKNFIRKLVGYQEKTLTEYRKFYQVDFYFDRDLMTDDVFHMNETTELRIFGRNQDVYTVNELIQRELEQIKIKTILLQMNDCKLLMDNVKEVKVLVDPCEIRVKRMMREWKDLRHPFYYLPNYFREMALIGKESEIKEAENRIDQFFISKREINYVNNQQISFLLPIYFKNLSMDMKVQLNIRCPQVQVFFYEPTYPRKHLTVLMIGPWNTLLQAKVVLEELANIYMCRNNHSFENFQQFTYHQQIRFSFKSLKRFVLEKDIKYLNHWDLCSIFVENAGKPIPNFDWSSFLNQPKPQKLTFNPLLLDPQQLQLMQRSQQQNSNLLFQHQQIANQTQLEQLKSEVKHQRQKDYSALIDFLKNQDVETCINSIFVLNDSNHAEESLRDLMTRLKVNKNELISFMLTMLSKNVNDFEDALRGFSHRWEPIKIIEQENNDSETLIIQQSRDVHRRPKGYYANASSAYYHHRSRSRSNSNSRYNNYTARNNYSSGYDRQTKYHEDSLTKVNFDNENKQGIIKDFDGQKIVEEEKNLQRKSSRSSSSYTKDKNMKSADSSSESSYDYKKYNRNPDSPDFTRPYLRQYKRSPGREYHNYHRYRYHGQYQEKRSTSRSRSTSRYKSYKDRHASRKRSSSRDSYGRYNVDRHHKSSHRRYYGSFYHGAYHYKSGRRSASSSSNDYDYHRRSKSRDASKHRSSRYHHHRHSSRSHRRHYHRYHSRSQARRSGFDSHNYYQTTGISGGGHRDPYYDIRALQDPNRRKNKGGFDYGNEQQQNNQSQSAPVKTTERSGMNQVAHNNQQISQNYNYYNNQSGQNEEGQI